MSGYHGQVTALILALHAQQHSCESLMMMSQMSEATVRKWIKTWRDADLIHVAGWQNDARGYPTIQLFAWQPGAADVPCPAMTPSQRVLAWKARKKAEEQA